MSDQRRWFDRAIFLGECLEPGRTRRVAEDAAEAPTRAEQLLQRWRGTCAQNDDGRFERRLSGLGLTADGAGDVFAPRRFAQTPPWADTAGRVAALAPAIGATYEWESDERTPFAGLYEPWARFALSDLGDRVEVNLDALSDSLRNILRVRLRQCGEPAVLELFKASGEPYRVWISGVLAGKFGELFEEIPVWGRLAATTTASFVDALAEFFGRLVSDEAEVRRELMAGCTHEWASISSAGDPHNGGRQVLILSTACGARVVYKPRSLAPEALASRTSDHLKSLKVVDVDLVAPLVDHGSHGWMAWVHTALPDSEQMQAYSHRAGVAMALAHRLAISDLHFENMIPAGAVPVLVDLECLANGRPNIYKRANPDDPPESMMGRSVMSTGMLVAFERYETDGRDVSALTGVLGDADTADEQSYQWHNLGQDSIDLVRSSKLARCDDAAAMVDVDALVEGLDAGEEAIDRSGLGTNVDPGVKVRVVVQDTAIYSRLLDKCVGLAMLRDGCRFSVELDRVARDSTHELASPWRIAAAEVERRTLESMDVPLFEVPLGSTNGRLGDHRIQGLTSEPGTVTIAKRLADRDRSNRRFQGDVARLLLETRLEAAGRAPRTRSAPVAQANPDPLAVCEAIARDLVERAVPDDYGGYCWLDAEQPGRFVRPVLTDNGLFAGNAGIAMFFAALAQLSGHERWAEFAAQSLAGKPVMVEHPLHDGTAGRGYALVAVGTILGDRATVDRGVALLFEIPAPGDLENVNPTDLIGGFAGIAAALGAAATMTADAGLARAATRYIDACRAGWKAGRHSKDMRERIAVERIGVAHGVTGIELAAARVIQGRAAAGLDDVDSDRVLVDWLGELLAGENERIDQRGGVPGRLHAVTREPDTGWCWGVSGFVMARRAVVQATGLDAATHGVEKGASLAARPGGSVDRLCCGGAARAWALEGRGLADAVNALVSGRGRWAFEVDTTFQSVSLLRGTAGVGLTLLASLDPARVPNPLVLEPAMTAATPQRQTTPRMH